LNPGESSFLPNLCSISSPSKCSSHPLPPMHDPRCYSACEADAGCIIVAGRDDDKSAEVYRRGARSVGGCGSRTIYRVSIWLGYTSAILCRRPSQEPLSHSPACALHVSILHSGEYIRGNTFGGEYISALYIRYCCRVIRLCALILVCGLTEPSSPRRPPRRRLASLWRVFR
jgi:hypothetical protein